MCGITGWVSYRADLRAQRPVLAAMTETMACRGPDDEGSWVGRHALLGHRRLAVIDLPGGRQPMRIATPRGPVVLVYSGETYNFRSLRADLQSRGEVFETRSDTEVVLRGYLQWGAGVAERVRGMYAFAIWDARTQTLVMVRDRLGVKPIYYYPTGDGLLFGSEPKAIFANPLAERRIGVSGLQELFAAVKTPGHAIWDGMYEVRPGTVTTVSRAGISERAYWRLESRPHADDLGATIARVRELMEDTVAEQLVADVPLCTLLSGGLDSSAMTALAAGYRRRQGAVVRSFAVDFTGHAEHFSPELVVQRDIDTPFARQVAATAGTDHTDIVLDSVGLADPSLRERAIRARDLPIGHGDLDTSLLLLFARIREHSTVALSGEAADELFGGYTQFFDPQAQRADAWPWIVHFRHQHDAELAMLTEELRNALDLETFWADSYASAIAPVDRIAGTSDFEHRMRKINYLHVTRSAQHLLDRKDRLSMAVGLEVRVPYCDHRLVEYVYNAPWAYKSHHGREKDLLRSAASDLLPRAVLDRVKSGYPATPHPAYLQAIQNQGADLAARVNHPVFELIRNDWLQETAHTPVDELPRTARKGMHLALGLAQWIDMYEPAITLS